MTLRYGIIGTGMMGGEHIGNVLATGRGEITTLADPHAPSREYGLGLVKDAGQDHEPACFEDHRELLGSGACDVVVVATPNMTHAAILHDVLAAPVHVLVEKPLCTTVADCKSVLAAAEGREHLVAVGLEYRYMAPVARLIDEVRSGTVGRVRMTAIREHRFPFLDKVGDWNRFRRNTGGTLVEKCCHYFDLMNHIADGARPQRVYASAGQDVNHLDEAYDGDVPDILDNAYVVVDYDDGSRAMLDLCMFAEATHNQEELVVVGDKGKVEAFVPESIVHVGRRGEHWIGGVETHEVRDERVAYEGFHHGSSYLEHLQLLDAIENGGQPAVTLEDGLWSVAVGEAAHRSVDEGRPILLTEVL